MKIRINDLCLNERFSLFAIFIFLIINWIRLATTQELAPPDFYEYYFYSKQIFSGDFNNFVIPPFFPILLGIMGGIIKLIPHDFDHFIMGGKIIALFSGLGVIYYAFRLLKIAVGKFAIFFEFLRLTDDGFTFFVICLYGSFLFFRKQSGHQHLGNFSWDFYQD